MRDKVRRTRVGTCAVRELVSRRDVTTDQIFSEIMPVRPRVVRPVQPRPLPAIPAEPLFVLAFVHGIFF